MPVPVSATDCGEFPALSKTISVAVCGVVLGGVKVTDTLQVFRGLSVFRHCDLMANGPSGTDSIWMVSDAPFFFAGFLISNDFGLLVVPTAVVVPSDRVEGICGGSGVALAVGVGVAVAVRVAVAVAVAVFVALPVAVGVAVAVTVAVLVAVAVGVVLAVAVGVGTGDPPSWNTVPAAFLGRAIEGAVADLDQAGIRIFAVGAIGLAAERVGAQTAGRRELEHGAVVTRATVDSGSIEVVSLPRITPAPGLSPSVQLVSLQDE